jgi:hypothetical protein
LLSDTKDLCITRKWLMPYLVTLKLSAFDTTVRSCMYLSETLRYKHVFANEQMTVRLFIQRY